MTYTHGVVVETIESTDRKAMIEFIARDDGFFEFREYVEVATDDPLISADGTHWIPGEYSGVYQTLESARSDAAGRVAWFRRQT